MTGTKHAPRKTSGFAIADGITLMRIPLAIAFVLLDDSLSRLIVLGLAGATDLGDGWVARRFGSSRMGAILDPIADKAFMACAFAVVFLSGKLEWFEILGVLARDIIATVAFIATMATGRRTAVPARMGGKVVTLLQLVTLLAFVLEWGALRRLAWATMAVALYAIYDYNQPFFRKLATR